MRKNMFSFYIRIYLFLAIGFVSQILFAQSDHSTSNEDDEYTEKYTYFTRGEEGLSDSRVYEISLAGRKNGKRIEDRISITIMETEVLNYGLEFGRRYFFGQDLRIYAGAGVFVGEYFECAAVDGVEECEDVDTTALYPEIGYMVSIGKARVVFFDRHYYQFTLNHPKHNMIGFSFGYQF